MADNLDWLYSRSSPRVNAPAAWDGSYWDKAKYQSALAAEGRSGGEASANLSNAGWMKALYPLSGLTQFQAATPERDTVYGGDSELHGHEDAAGAVYKDKLGRMYRDTGKDASGNALVQYFDGNGEGWAPPGSDGKVRLKPTYSLDAQGNATPVSSGSAYTPSEWVRTGQPVATLAAAMAGAYFGGTALAGAGGAGEAGGAGGAGGAVAGGGSGGLTEAQLSALYGNAGKGALINGGTTAMRGGSLSDVLKSAAIGGATGAFGSAVSAANPAGYAGITNPTLGSAVNGAISSGSVAALRGGNAGQAAGSSFFNSALGAAGNYFSEAPSSGGGNKMSYDYGSGGDYNNFSADSTAPWTQARPDMSYDYGSGSGGTGGYDFNTDTSPSGGNGNAFSALGSLITQAGRTLGSPSGAGATWGQLLGAGMGFYNANKAQGRQQESLDGATSSLAASQKLAQDQWDYQKNVFLPQQQARSDAAFGLTSKLANQQLDDSKYYRGIAGQNFDQAKKSWEFQDTYSGMARDYASGATANTMANQAGADVQQAGAMQRGITERAMLRRGVNPGSGAGMAMMHDDQIAQAASGAGAQTNARLMARNKAEQMVGIAAGAGASGFGTGLGAGGLSTGAANSAGANAVSGVNTGNSINNSYTSGASSAGSGFSNAAYGYNRLIDSGITSPMGDYASGLMNGWTKQNAAYPQNPPPQP